MNKELFLVTERRFEDETPHLITDNKQRALDVAESLRDGNKKYRTMTTAYVVYRTEFNMPGFVEVEIFALDVS